MRDLSEIRHQTPGAVVSIGNFDGVHAGHQTILGKLTDLARSQSLPAWIFTFDPHPLTLLKPEAAPPPLMWIDRKAEVLGRLGIDTLIAYPTSHDLLRLSARDFFQQILIQQLGTQGLVEGENFFFGRNREGDVKMLAELCDEAAIPLNIVPLLGETDHVVSSSQIRRLIAQGNLAQANQMLIEPYQIRGKVASGDQRGRTLGFPTANLVDCDVLLPGKGVYAGTIRLGKSQYPAAVHIGPNPTFSQVNDKVEVHIIDFSGNLYDQTLVVQILEQIRTVSRFESTESLKRQLAADVAQAKSVAAAWRKRQHSQ